MRSATACRPGRLSTDPVAVAQELTEWVGPEVALEWHGKLGAELGARPDVDPERVIALADVPHLAEELDRLPAGSARRGEILAAIDAAVVAVVGDLLRPGGP